MKEINESGYALFKRLGNLSDAHIVEASVCPEKQGLPAFLKSFAGIAGLAAALALVARSYLKDGDAAALLFLSEESRRIRELYEHYKMSGMEGELDLDKMFPMKYKLVLNTNNDLIAKIGEMNGDDELTGMLIKQIYDTALLNLRQLTPEELQAYTKRTNDILAKLV